MPNIAEKRSMSIEPLGGEPVRVEEALLLDEGADAGFDQLGGELDVVGKVVARNSSTVPEWRSATSLRLTRTRVWAPPPILSEL